MKSSQTEIAVTIEDETWLDDLPNAEDICRQAVLAALRGAGLRFAGAMEISVLLTDDAVVQGLNARYRGKDSATNVLSFPSDDVRLGLSGVETALQGSAGDSTPGDLPLLLGDIVLAHGTVAKEAGVAAKPLDDHVCHLVVHGVLHLLGHDHGVESEATAMERLETSILSGLGIPDPYQPSPSV